MPLKEFMTRMTTYGVQKQNKYRVFITSPTGTSAGINIMAEAVSMPGQNVRTATDTLRYGPQREHAQAMMYGPISITFICTPGMPEKKYFENWQNMIINKNSWEAKFYKDYIGAIDIFSMDSEEADRYVSLLYEVFPKTVNAQDFGAGSNDAYQTITVEFAFRWWESMFLPSPKRQKPEMHFTFKDIKPISQNVEMTERARVLAKKGYEKLTNTPPTTVTPSDIFIPTPAQPTSLQAHLDTLTKLGAKPDAPRTGTVGGATDK